MKIDLNDPRITAFALGELTGDDAVELARAVRMDERVRQAVDEVRGTARLLGGLLTPGGAEMLTADQRNAIHSAGSSPVIEDIASARVSFWKKPSVVAAGVAAAVAATLYIVGGRPPSGGEGVATQKPEWNWSQVATSDLTAPVSLGSGSEETGTSTPGSAHAVSAAASDDHEGFRATIRQRIASSELKAAQELPELENNDWQDVMVDAKIAVPLSSGAASWPWVRRHIMDAGELPPRRAVRIEEMINHFSYRKPGMVQRAGLAADMELCHTPWNPQTCLLAIHVQALPGADVDRLKASLLVRSDRVKKLRLLGYASVSSHSAVVTAPVMASRTRGNYLIYELQVGEGDSGKDKEPLVSLKLAGGGLLANKEPKAWVHASPDLRFASIIAATGMMLSDYPAMGELDINRLASMSDLAEQQDGEVMTAERQSAMQLVRRVIGLFERTNK